MKSREGQGETRKLDNLFKEANLIGDVREVALASYDGVLKILGQVHKASSITAVTMSVLPFNRFGEIADTRVGRLFRAINEIETPRRELLVDPFALSAATGGEVAVEQGWPGWDVRPWGMVPSEVPNRVPKRLQRWLMFWPFARNHARILLFGDTEIGGTRLPSLAIISARDFSRAFPDRDEDFFISTSLQLGEWLSGHLSSDGVSQFSKLELGKTQVIFTGGEAGRTKEFLDNFIAQNVQLGDSIVVFSGFPHLPVVWAARKVAKKQATQKSRECLVVAQSRPAVKLFSSAEFVKPGVGVSGAVDLFYELVKAVELGLVKGVLGLGGARLLEVQLKRTGIAHHKVLLVLAPDGKVKVWAAGTFNFAGVNIINRTNDIIAVSSDPEIGKVMLEKLRGAGAVMPP